MDKSKQKGIFISVTIAFFHSFVSDYPYYLEGGFGFLTDRLLQVQIGNAGIAGLGLIRRGMNRSRVRPHTHWPGSGLSWGHEQTHAHRRLECRQRRDRIRIIPAT